MIKWRQKVSLIYLDFIYFISPAYIYLYFMLPHPTSPHLTPSPFTSLYFECFRKLSCIYLYYIKSFERFHLKSLKLQQILFQTHLSRNILRKSVICHLYSNTKTSNHFFHDALSCCVVRITGLTFWIKKKNPTSPENHTLHC